MKQIILFWFLIVSSFLVASICFVRENFLFFELLWRVSIIAGVYFFGRPRFSFTRKQWITLLLIFILTFGITRVFSSSHSFLYSLLAVILGPLAEEMFFRGWLISRLEGSKRDKIVKSSFLFSLYHLKNAFLLPPLALAYQLLYSGLVIGPIFAWVRLRYDSLFPSIVLHSVNNTIGLTITERFFPSIIKRFPLVT
ncbi:MAG TPA: CPBP family intramembrane glutamic endopeptidase [Patescibacteria group bacterium]|nr:CPBP family intramembrane glutamic endopeptidase [Patescibacteria group bacterium]